MTKKLYIKWDEFHNHAKELCEKIKQSGEYNKIVAISRGGLIPAGILAHILPEDKSAAGYERFSPYLISRPQSAFFHQLRRHFRIFQYLHQPRGMLLLCSGWIHADSEDIRLNNPELSGKSTMHHSSQSSTSGISALNLDHSTAEDERSFSGKRCI